MMGQAQVRDQHARTHANTHTYIHTHTLELKGGTPKGGALVSSQRWHHLSLSHTSVSGNVLLSECPLTSGTL